ncbi:MAG: YciI family protein [Neisseria sp.]|uniref:YciI family protein n=1 Tax=Neisseria sp. TaxID=192066 RepID=UPI0026DA8E68|nr:YciI family protein [Neisseria sp.]MDO4249023.1 YciI family protein [Neisseria sp.]
MSKTYFMLLATDAEGTHEARMAARPAHLARLEALKAAGDLMTAGPNPLPEQPDRVSGSLIIAKFEDLDAAQAWAEADPYVDAGVYEEVLIKPFKAVFEPVLK